jgi:DNA-binding GntR family transcriptional regulator
MVSMLAETGYERLRSGIVRGAIPPGTRLAEAGIATRLGVSRTPAREALARLHREGFLVAVGSRTRLQLAVAPLTPADLRDAFALLGALAGLAARAIAEFAPGERPELARRLRQLSEARQRVAARPDHDTARVFELRDTFHRALTDHGPARVRAAAEAARAQVHRYEWACASLQATASEDSSATDAAVVQAVLTGTAAELERSVRAAWAARAEALSPMVERLVSRVSW